MTKKDEAFGLFDEGKIPNSPELKGRSRYNYYYQWQKSGGSATLSPRPSEEAKGKVISELEMIAEPMEEVNGEAILVDWYVIRMIEGLHSSQFLVIYGGISESGLGLQLRTKPRTENQSKVGELCYWGDLG